MLDLGSIELQTATLVVILWGTLSFGALIGLVLGAMLASGDIDDRERP